MNLYGKDHLLHSSELYPTKDLFFASHLFLLNVVQVDTLDHYKMWHRRSFCTDKLYPNSIPEKLYCIRKRDDLLSWTLMQPIIFYDNMVLHDKEAEMIQIVEQRGYIIATKRVMQKIYENIGNIMAEVSKTFDIGHPASIIRGYIIYSSED